MQSSFGEMTHLTDPNGGPRGQKPLGLGATELRKPPKLRFLKISKKHGLADSAPNANLFWGNGPSNCPKWRP